MNKFGYAVWLAYELPGSFEGGPPALIDHAKRDLRWCRGNLQHAWLLSAKGFRAISRLHLAQGVLSYTSSLLWLLFLAAGTLRWYRDVHGGTATGAQTGFLLRMGVDHRVPLFLFLFMIALLVMPKVLATIHIVTHPEHRSRFGGGTRFLLSVVLEQAVASLLAPLQMLFHSVFVVTVLCGRTVHWTPQNRDAEGVDWREAMLTHAGHTLTGAAWGLLAWWIDPLFFVWMVPVLAGMVLSVPLSIVLSHQKLGQAVSRVRLFQTPAETAPSAELVEYARRMEAYEEEIATPEALRIHRGFMQVLLDPLVNALHVSLLRQRGKSGHALRDYYQRLMERLLKDGPGSLNRREQMALLMHPQAVVELHERIWLLPDRELAPWWRVAMSQYNLIAGRTVHLLKP
jgi:membrane glycosyltransferase